MYVFSNLLFHASYFADNMFFSAHVLRLKQSETGVPSERGSVARLVGTAWKVRHTMAFVNSRTSLCLTEKQSLSAEEKQYYEREADKHNGMHPVKDDVDDEDEEDKRQHHHMADPYAHMHPHSDMHMHGMGPMHGHQPQHDPRHHGYAYATHHMYAQPPYGHYDYAPPQQHHHTRHSQGRSHGGYGHTYPPQQRNHYEGM